MTQQRRLSKQRIKDHWLWRYGLAVVLFGAALGLSLLLSNFGIKINLTIPLVLALVATAWYGGRGPGILISVLFQATTIIYVPMPPDSTVAKAWFGYLSVFSLYIFLIFVISGLRRIQHRLAEQRDLLQVTLSSIGDAVITTDTKGRVTFMNEVATRLTGWEDASSNGVALKEVFRITNEETGEPVADPVKRVLETGGAVGLANHTILKSKTGREIPIDDSAAPIRDGGEIKGVVLVFADVTERRLAERARRETEIMHRIVNAQEAERHRIARDLHDHLGQQMTALRLQIESVADEFSDDPALADAMDDVQEAAQKVDRDIGYLSWELRPTELEQLGLENALSSFVREWSSQHGIAAEFLTSQSDNGTTTRRLAQTAETNLYRIAQEALNNVVKHADAESVNVLLQHRDDQTVLIIEDDGRGFDHEIHTTDGSTPGGLGLLGMQERASLLKGALEIDSTPGSGTTILARIPVT